MFPERSFVFTEFVIQMFIKKATCVVDLFLNARDHQVPRFCLMDRHSTHRMKKMFDDNVALRNKLTKCKVSTFID